MTRSMTIRTKIMHCKKLIRTESTYLASVRRRILRDIFYGRDPISSKECHVAITRKKRRIINMTSVLLIIFHNTCRQGDRIKEGLSYYPTSRVTDISSDF